MYILRCHASFPSHRRSIIDGMETVPLIDSFGRVARDLRLSVTDRCNFRCVYCMPPDGLDWLPREEVLSFEEMLRLVRILAACGVDTVRITGGEPLARARVEVLVEMIARALPQIDLSMTTNGYRLAEKADALAAAGLRRVNVSVDSLRAETFHAMTRRDALSRVLEGLAAAARAGLRPLKINAVMVRGVMMMKSSTLRSWRGSATITFASSNTCRWTRDTSGRSTRWSRPVSCWVESTRRSR
jgi:cyclic pyranopterin phosphate synthase